MRFRVSQTRQFPKRPIRTLSFSNRPYLSIFEVPDDVLSQIFSFLSRKGLLASQRTCRHFAIVSFRPSSVSFPLKVNCRLLPSKFTGRDLLTWKRVLNTSHLCLNSCNSAVDMRMLYHNETLGRRVKKLSIISVFSGLVISIYI